MNSDSTRIRGRRESPSNPSSKIELKKSIKTPIYKREWGSLSSIERIIRVRALETLRLVKSGHPLYPSSKSVGVDARTVKRALGPYLYKKKGRWKARKTDRISRSMTIYEGGQVRGVIINDSNMAHLIGKYFNSVKQLLESGDLTLLHAYRDVVIVDSKDKKHRLETDLEKIKLIELGREQEYGGEIYEY